MRLTERQADELQEALTWLVEIELKTTGRLL